VPIGAVPEGQAITDVRGNVGLIDHQDLVPVVGDERGISAHPSVTNHHQDARSTHRRLVDVAQDVVGRIDLRP
jgi:hypothetical protein